MICLCKILAFYANYTILPFDDYNKGGKWYVSVLASCSGNLILTYRLPL